MFYCWIQLNLSLHTMTENQFFCYCVFVYKILYQTNDTQIDTEFFGDKATWKNTHSKIGMLETATFLAIRI